jgi:hypothetical protein
MMDCPKCYLPREDTAWQCDGCGYEFSQDFENVRSSLRAQLKTRRTVFWLTVLVNLGIVGGIVFLATHGWIYISVPLMLAVVGSTGHTAHRITARWTTSPTCGAACRYALAGYRRWLYLGLGRLPRRRCGRILFACTAAPGQRS